MRCQRGPYFSNALFQAVERWFATINRPTASNTAVCSWRRRQCLGHNIVQYGSIRNKNWWTERWICRSCVWEFRSDRKQDHQGSSDSTAVVPRQTLTPMTRTATLWAATKTDNLSHTLHHYLYLAKVVPRIHVWLDNLPPDWTRHQRSYLEVIFIVKQPCLPPND